MKRSTFNIPTVQGTETREGYRVWLHFGEGKRAFMLQLQGDRPCILADYASGYRLADLGGAMLERYVRHPAAFRGQAPHQWRDLAQAWLDRAVDQKGYVVINTVLTAVPAINGVK